MAEDELTSRSATELAALVARRQASAAEVLDAFADRIQRLNPGINAVIHLDLDRARSTARRLDGRRTPVGPLHGVPMTLKDAHRVAGMPTVVGDPDAPRRPATRDGYVATRLRAAGAVIMGKTNVARALADFQTDNPVHGVTRNPWDPWRTPGGSSGGAAAAVAAGLTPLEVGSDIAGSVRLPAAFTGIVGLKPSAGVIPATGHVTEPVAHPSGGGVNALATPGPMARSIADVELALGVLAPRTRAMRFDPSQLSVGLIAELPGLRVAAPIRRAIDDFARVIARRGAQVDTVEPPADPSAQHATWVAVYEAARADGASWPTRGRRLARAAAGARDAWIMTLRRHPLLILPTVMCTAFTHRPTGTPIDIDGVAVPYWGLARYTEPFNLTGLPALSIPLGRDPGGLPIGLQLVAASGRDRWLLAAAAWLSAAIPPLPQLSRQASSV